MVKASLCTSSAELTNMYVDVTVLVFKQGHCIAMKSVLQTIVSLLCIYSESTMIRSYNVAYFYM